jgi:hypothetical protein
MDIEVERILCFHQSQQMQKKKKSENESGFNYEKVFACRLRLAWITFLP